MSFRYRGCSYEPDPVHEPFIIEARTARFHYRRDDRCMWYRVYADGRPDAFVGSADHVPKYIIRKAINRKLINAETKR